MSDQFHNVDAWGDQEKDLVKIQEKFLQYFPPKGTVLDLGSGRGIFLDLLKKNGFSPMGVEMDSKMHGISVKKGHAVDFNDAISFLSATSKRFDGIFASHIIEHLSADDGVKFIDLIKARLNPGGVAIIITPRPGSLWATENFWLDTTHIRPFPFLLMRQLFIPWEILDGGTEPDSSPIKGSPFAKKWILRLRKRIIGRDLFDFAYGGGVSYIVARKPENI